MESSHENGSIFGNFRDTFDTIGVSEAAAGRVFLYFMCGDAEDIPPEKFEIVEVDVYGVSAEASDGVSWSHVLKTLPIGFMIDGASYGPPCGATSGANLPRGRKKFSDRIYKALSSRIYTQRDGKFLGSRT